MLSKTCSISSRTSTVQIAIAIINMEPWVRLEKDECMPVLPKWNEIVRKYDILSFWKRGDLTFASFQGKGRFLDIFGGQELRRNFHSTPDLAQEVACLNSQTLPNMKSHRSQEDLFASVGMNRNLPPPNHPPPPPPQVHVLKFEIPRPKSESLQRDMLPDSKCCSKFFQQKVAVLQNQLTHYFMIFLFYVSIYEKISTILGCF